MGRIGFVVEGLPGRSASGTSPSAQSWFPVLGPWTLFVASTADEAGRTDGWRLEKAGYRVGIVELHEDGEGYLVCPLRGEIDVQWCLGCPRRLRVSYEGDRTVIVCDPGSGPPHDRQAGALRDVPESFRIY